MTKNPLQWRWLTYAVRGVLALLFGAAVLLIPTTAKVSLVTVFAIYAIVDGLLVLALAPSELSRNYVLVRSAISIGAGVVALILGRSMSFGAVIILLSMWAGAAGMTELGVVFRMRGPARTSATVVLHAVATLVFGLAIMLSPLTGFVVTAVWVAVYAVVFGALLEAAALALRKLVPVTSPEPA